MCKVICIPSTDDSNGKSESALNIAASLSILENKTLYIDLEGRSGIYQKQRLINNNIQLNPDELLTEKGKFRTGIQQTIISRLDYISIIANEKPDTDFSIHPELIKENSTDYDYVVLDSHFPYDWNGYFSMVSSDFLILPMKLKAVTIKNINKYLKDIQGLIAKINDKLKIAGLFFEGVHSSEQVKGFFSDNNLRKFSDYLYRETIPQRSGPVSKNRIPYALRDIKSAEAEAYLRLSYEISEKLSSNNLT